MAEYSIDDTCIFRWMLCQVYDSCILMRLHTSVLRRIVNNGVELFWQSAGRTPTTEPSRSNPRMKESCNNWSPTHSRINRTAAPSYCRYCPTYRQHQHSSWRLTPFTFHRCSMHRCMNSSEHWTVAVTTMFNIDMSEHWTVTLTMFNIEWTLNSSSDDHVQHWHEWTLNSNIDHV